MPRSSAPPMAPRSGHCTIAFDDRSIVSDIYKTPETPGTRYRSRPELHASRSPGLRQTDLQAGLWTGIGLLAAAILVVIAFTAWLLRSQSP